MHGNQFMCMKVLVVYDETQADNLFVSILCRAIREQNIELQCSRLEFWEGHTRFDIIHFQWPEEVVGWNCNTPETIEKLKQRIEYYRQQGTRFVYTRHNECSHYVNKIIAQAYILIETSADTIVHLGQYSYNELHAKYPGKQHRIIPHHIYENAYNENITSLEARRKLNIPENRYVITAFGKFRNREEMKMMLTAYLRSGIRHKYLLAPRLYPFSRHRQGSLLKQIVTWILWQFVIPIVNKIFHIQGDSNEKIVPNKDLSYYLAASDLIFIQRKRILNSGNVPLAFLFRKTVVGPDCGNVGELLRDSGNPVFDPGKPASIKKALKQAFQLNEKQQGEANYRYAIQYLNLSKVGKMYAKTYEELHN